MINQMKRRYPLSVQKTPTAPKVNEAPSNKPTPVIKATEVKTIDICSNASA
jgi:hypothetical protein